MRLATVHLDQLYDINYGLLKDIDGKIIKIVNDLSIEFTNFVHVFNPSENSYITLQKGSDV